MKLISTKDVHTDGVKLLVYGASGVGKTTLIKSLKDPFIISSESGLLSLADVDIPAVEVVNEQGLEEAYEYVRTSKYVNICLDSISDISESMLGIRLAKFTDGRQAYGANNIITGKYLRLFRGLKGKNVYFTAKEGKTELNGVTMVHPAMPGTTLTTNLPYVFDLVLRLEANKKGDRILHTSASFTQVAKDRSGKLDKTEVADLTLLINKITGKV